MVNLGTKNGGGGIKPPPSPSIKSEGKSILRPMTEVVVYLMVVLLALTAAVTSIASYKLRRDASRSLVSMQQITDVNGSIDTQAHSPVRFIVVVENGNVVGMYESKGGVISTIQTNQFEVLRK